MLVKPRIVSERLWRATVTVTVLQSEYHPWYYPLELLFWGINLPWSQWHLSKYKTVPVRCKHFRSISGLPRPLLISIYWIDCRLKQRYIKKKHIFFSKEIPLQANYILMVSSTTLLKFFQPKTDALILCKSFLHSLVFSLCLIYKKNDFSVAMS